MPLLPMIAVAAATFTGFQRGPADGMGVVVLRQVTVIDGNGGAPLRDAAVVVDGERIGYVGPAAELRLEPDARVIELPGRWVVPGFIDMHAHMPGPAAQPRVLAALLASGITTARSTASEP